jgi:hypothetical protein
VAENFKIKNFLVDEKKEILKKTAKTKQNNFVSL